MQQKEKSRQGVVGQTRLEAQRKADETVALARAKQGREDQEIFKQQLFASRLNEDPYKLLTVGQSSVILLKKI